MTRDGWSVVLVATLAAAGAASACGDSDPPGREAAPSASAEATAGSAVPGATAPSAEVPRPSAAEGKALVDRLECARCHEGTGMPAVPQNKHCFSCHVDIAAGTFQAAPKLLTTWKPRVEHLRYVPSLAGVGRIVDPGWVTRYLLKPTDLRPGLHATMPRLPLSDLEAAHIAAYLGELAGYQAGADRELPRGDAERGRALFAAKACNTCHAFTGARTDEPKPVTASDAADRALAPDLRLARERLIPGRVVDWILDAPTMKPGAAMPKQNVTREEATHLAVFILTASLDGPPPARPRARLPPLDRPVGYDEVAARVLHKICWHCHSQPDFARGDGGPGNTGGFGFAARKLDLSSYESIAGGYLDTNGERRSLFSPAPGGEPMLLSVLLERAKEERGTFGPLRGMPLGLPALPAEDIQLVETWIAQGHPR